MTTGGKIEFLAGVSAGKVFGTAIENWEAIPTKYREGNCSLLLLEGNDQDLTPAPSASTLQVLFVSRSLLPLALGLLLLPSSLKAYRQQHKVAAARRVSSAAVSAGTSVVKTSAASSAAMAASSAHSTTSVSSEAQSTTS